MEEMLKWADVSDDGKTILEFLDFLCSKGVYLGEYRSEQTERMYSYSGNRQDLVYEFFEIDAKKLEQERRELIESIQRERE